MEFHCSLYKNKTTRTFEHRGEAWRGLTMQRFCFYLEQPNFLKKKVLRANFLAVLSGEHQLHINIGTIDYPLFVFLDDIEFFDFQDK